MTSWTGDEEVILRQHYYDSPQDILLALLPSRTWRAISQKANSLRVVRVNHYKSHEPKPESWRRAVSATLKGRPKSQRWKEQTSARLKVNNPSKRTEVRFKISQTLRTRLAKEPELRTLYASNFPKRQEGELNPFYGHRHTDKTKNAISQANKGRLVLEKNPNWQQGKSFEPYTASFNRRVKDAVFVRDNKQCRLCSRANARKYDIHHIDLSKANSDPTNLVTLCAPCHGRVHHSPGPHTFIPLAEAAHSW